MIKTKSNNKAMNSWRGYKQNFSNKMTSWDESEVSESKRLFPGFQRRPIMTLFVKYLKKHYFATNFEILSEYPMILG